MVKEDTLLEVENLKVSFKSDKKELTVIDGVSFDIEKGKTLGMAGESGCGKSVTSMALMGLLSKKGKIRGGEVHFKGEDLLKKNNAQMRRIRGDSIAMIFQEAMTSLNPVFTIGGQLTEAIRIHMNLSAAEAKLRVLHMLTEVGIPHPDTIFKSYPHMLSGGMQQRVMIAMAMLCHPELLIADEPTTALDVTIQAQILGLMKKFQIDTGTSILLITHDLGVLAEMADRVVIMYAGQIVEEADVFSLFDRPMHPYTQGLMDSVAHVWAEENKRLSSIKGSVPPLTDMPKGCRFHNRCAFCRDKCKIQAPPLLEIRKGHFVRCFKSQWEEKEGPLNA